MKKKGILIPVILAIAVINAFGIALRYLDLPAFIILLGFRFHISLVLPLLFIVNRITSGELKQEFTDPEFKKNYIFVLSLFLPLLLIAGLYYLDFIIISDPDYFYEFGMSSILDLPVYLIWNAPQLIMFYLFLNNIVGKISYKYFTFPLVFTSLFAFEFIPIDYAEPDIISVFLILIIAFLNLLLLAKFTNLYWFVIFNFLLLWMPLLLFGTTSPTLIKLIFASRYNSWEGLLEAAKKFSDYESGVFIACVFIILTFFFVFIKREKISDIST